MYAAMVINFNCCFLGHGFDIGQVLNGFSSLNITLFSPRYLKINVYVCTHITHFWLRCLIRFIGESKQLSDTIFYIILTFLLGKGWPVPFLNNLK